MWEVSSRFLNALGTPHRIITEATVTPPSADPITLKLKGGSVSADAGANYRRTGALSLLGGQAVYEALTAPGAIVHIDHGISFGNEQELVPVFHGEVETGSQEFGDSTLSCRLVDLNKRVERVRFLAPFSATSSSTRPAMIAQIVQDARPGTEVNNISTDTGTVGSVVWDESRIDAIKALSRDGALDAFWLPDGRFQIRQQLDLSSPSVWTVTPGVRGVLKAASRARPMDRMYNTVVVRPSATDGSQTWTQQVVQITDPNHPRHPDKIGVVPYFWASPTASSAAVARKAGQSILSRVLGSTESVDLRLMSNPALEAGDPIRVVTPQIGHDEAAILSHFVDSFTLDLVSGEMRLQTRSQVIDD